MKLFYRTLGSGPPLIILHGLFGSSDNWISFAKSISNRFTIYLPDLRNHGQSPHSPVHDYGSMAGDVSELADTLGLNKFFLAGHSMGGKTSIRLAVKEPDRLAGLLVADISPFRHPDQNREEYGRHLAILDFIIASNVAKLKTRSEVNDLLKKSIGSAKVRELILKNLQRNKENSFSWKINARALLENFDNITGNALDDSESSDEISGFPVYFLKGEFSNYIADNDIPRIKLLFPGAEIITVPGAGHWIHADNPDTVKRYFIRLVDNL